MRLWKVHIKTYHFGILYYDLFVLADTESNMLRTVYRHPSYSINGVEIVTYEEVDFNNHMNRVLLEKKIVYGIIFHIIGEFVVD